MKAFEEIHQLLLSVKNSILFCFLILFMNPSVMAVDFIDPDQQATKCIYISIDLVQNFEGDLIDVHKISGNYPTGLTFKFDDIANTAILSGIPSEINTFIFTMEATDLEGTSTQTFNFEIINIDAGDPGETCQETDYSVTGIDYTGVTFNWSENGTGSFANNTLANPVYQTGTGETGTVTLTLQITNGTCTASDDHTLDIIAKPAPPEADDNKEICFGENNPAFNATGTGLEWFDNAELTNSVGTGTSYTPPSTVSAVGTYTYYVTQTIDNCRSSAATVELEIKPIPDPPGDQIINQQYTGEDVTISVVGNEIKWYDEYTSTNPTRTGNDSILDEPTTNTYTFYVTQTVDGCESAKSTITLNITRPNVDVVLVLDKSGSMRSNAPGTATSKWTVLYEAIHLFLDQYLEFKVTDDQVGTVLFNHTLDVLNDGAGNTLMDISSNAISNIEGVIINPIAGGLTAMGGGLQMGINILDPVNNPDPKNIILFTDGMQNRNLWVDPTTLEIVIDPGRPAPDVTMPSPDGSVLNSSLGIKVFTIGVGATEPFRDLLSNIGAGTGADFRITSDPVSDLDQFFTESFVDALSLGSPQLVDYRYGELSGNSYTENFKINKDVTKLYVKLLFDRGSDLDMEVMRGDISFPENSEVMKSGEFFKIFRLNFPFIFEDQEMKSDGEWKFKITGTPGTKYKIAAIVNDHKLDYTSRIEPDYLMAGDRMNLILELKYDSQPVTDAQKVTAYVLQPGEDIGELLARTSVRDQLKKRKIILEQDKEYIQSMMEKDTLLRDYCTDAERKLKLLLDNPEILEKLLPKQRKVRMKHTGDGIYEGRTRRCKTQGSYRILYRIEGSDEEIGDYYRLEDKSVMVNIADPSLFRSQIRIIPADPASNKPARLYLRPRDKFGNYLGPGYREYLKVKISNGSAPVIQGQLDGSYIIPLDRVSEISTAEIEILFKERTLFRFDLGKIKKRLPWWMPKVIKQFLDMI